MAARTPAAGALAALAVLASACIAHFPRPDEPTLFVERTYLGVPLGQGQVFEAAPAVHVLLWNGLDQPDVWRKSDTHLVLSTSVLATVRMYGEASNPVRTPSYDPRLKLQVVRVAAGDASTGGPRPAVGVAALDLTVGHNSNGQKGCALADHLRGTGFSDFDCVPLTDPPSTALNLVDGSFTRNYVGAALRGKLLFPAAGGGAAAYTLSAGGGLEWNVPCHFGGCIEAPMAARYGDVVARWSVEGDALVVRDVHRRLPGIGSIGLDARLRATVSGTVNLGLEGRDPFGSVAFELAYTPRYSRGLGVGLFGRYHHGRDYLNIRFEQRYDAWMVGLVIDPSPPERP